MLPAAHIQRARVHSVRPSNDDELELNVVNVAGDKNENPRKTLAQVRLLI